MTNTISRYDFEEAVQDITDEGSVRADYSGRGMYGRTCIGVVVDPSSARAVKSELHKAAERIREDIEEDEDDLEWDSEEELADKLDQLAESVSIDNMGLDMIVYFPGWEFSD